ncbi:MAG: hypothetical protein JSW71_16950 [Gemmatimonadota bacterium]|nr:MAG: hypothetical protein JSW71_16950 [Gemmatimonadota bacterium]
MPFSIRKVNYFHVAVDDQPGEAYKFLTTLAEMGISLLAFTAIPIGPSRTQFTVFPEDESKIREVVQATRLNFDGPYPALLAQGDDELGALTGIHHKLYEAGVNVYASSAVADGRGSYGYVLYVRPEKLAEAAAALGL